MDDDIHPPGSENRNRVTITAQIVPMLCATMKAKTPLGAMPAKLLVNPRAIVTAGFAKDVEAVNQ